MLLISDDMSLLDADSARIFQEVARIGGEVDAASKVEPPIVMDLMSDSRARTLSIATRAGALHLIINMGDSPQRVDAPAEPGNLPLELAPHSARIIRSTKG